MKALESLLLSIKKHQLVVATLVSVVLGICVGSGLREWIPEWTVRKIMYMNFLGELFLRILKSLILPLIATSLLTGISSLELKMSRKIGGRAIAFYLTTTFVAVVLGITLVSVIKPGVGITVDSEDVSKSEQKKTNTVDTLLDLLRNLCPPNIIQACLEQSATELIPPKNNINSSDINEYQIKIKFVDGTNILGVVAVSTVIGIAMSILKTELTYFTFVINEFYVLIMKLTNWAVALSPIGIFFLVVSQILSITELEKVSTRLGYYFLTVVLGCLIQGFVILPTLYWVFTRKNPLKFIRGLSQALMTAFGTSSSSATLPITLKCVVENNQIDENIAKFMLPIGSAINMDGTALYEAVAAIFIAQLEGVQISFGQLIAVSITATAASIGAAGIPSAGLVTMIMVLETIGLPAEDVSIILAVDWLLDRVRTTVNVLGDAFGAGIIDHCSKDDIMEIKSRNNSSNLSLNAALRTDSNNNSSISRQRLVQSNISIIGSNTK